MKIVGAHLLHDGGVAVAVDGQLRSCLEASKSNQDRYATLDDLSLGRLYKMPSLFDGDPPDAVAIGGWFGYPTGYFGVGSEDTRTKFLSIQTNMCEFATTHERAHIFCAYALSHFPQGEPCYALVYEGTIGTFYKVDAECGITRLCSPMTEPGHRYAAVFELADQKFPGDSCGMSSGSAGKLMALASAPSSDYPLAPAEEQLLRMLVDEEHPADDSWSVVIRKERLRGMPHWNCGHLNEHYRHFAARACGAIFDRFYAAAKDNLRERLPLLISGGCGLNCNWNTHWRNSGLFHDVFVPPCPDDSGIAVGVVADAQRHFTGSAKLAWSVYSGEPFGWDATVPDTFEHFDLDYSRVVSLLREGAVIAWVQGRAEIGPRALGNRSLLAAPFERATTDRLNWIKKREAYRPIAPVCLAEEVSKWFDWSGASPYMLYFQRVKSPRLAAITHHDGSARVQTVSAAENPPLHELLRVFSELTGVGVLCNTSLNFPGRGFINKMSDLVCYVTDRELDAMVVEDHLFVRRRSSGTANSSSK